MDSEQYILPLDGLIKKFAYVGSRATCNPAPTNTDIDMLFLVTDVAITHDKLSGAGFSFEGSAPFDCNRVQAPQFSSYRREDVNMIITTDETFFDRFIAASTIAKRLNLLYKQDRIDLFQAVLYGNGCGGITVY